MITCTICATGYKSSEDRLIYGCYLCSKGSHKQSGTENMKLARSPYLKGIEKGEKEFKRKLYIKHNIPLELAEDALCGKKTAKNLFAREGVGDD